MPNMGPPMSALAMPQYANNAINPNPSEVHQANHYDHLVQQSQHTAAGSYPTGFHHNSSLLPQNYSGSVHFQQSSVDYAKIASDDYTKFTAEQLAKMTASPPPSASATSIPTSIKTYTDHMADNSWNQMYSHHQVYGPPNEYSQMQTNYANSNTKYWS